MNPSLQRGLLLSMKAILQEYNNSISRLHPTVSYFMI